MNLFFATVAPSAIVMERGVYLFDAVAREGGRGNIVKFSDGYDICVHDSSATKPSDYKGSAAGRTSPTPTTRVLDRRWMPTLIDNGEKKKQEDF